MRATRSRATPFHRFLSGFRDYVRRVMGPYLLLRFFALPAPLLLLPGGRLFYKCALINLALADVLSNIHSFIIIATKCARGAAPHGVAPRVLRARACVGGVFCLTV